MCVWLRVRVRRSNLQYVLGGWIFARPYSIIGSIKLALARWIYLLLLLACALPIARLLVARLHSPAG